MAGGREREEVERGVMGDGVRVGEDGRGHYGNHAWVSGLRIGEMVWVNVPTRLGMDFSRFTTKWG